MGLSPPPPPSFPRHGEHSVSVGEGFPYVGVGASVGVQPVANNYKCDTVPASVAKAETRPIASFVGTSLTFLGERKERAINE